MSGIILLMIFYLMVFYWSIATFLQWMGWLIANHIHSRQHLLHAEKEKMNDVQLNHVNIQLSVIVPAHNERQNILSTLHAIFQIPAKTMEVIVVDDGSTDGTYQLIASHFPNQCQLIRQSKAGKSVALNRGIQIARYPWVLIVDADTVIRPQGIRELLDQAINRKGLPLGAMGGAIHIEPQPGLLTNMQMIEYQRSFGIGLPASSMLNSVLLIPGACSLFATDALKSVGGFNPECLAEDLDIILRLHQLNHFRADPYQIQITPVMVATTEPVLTMAHLRRQRIRWQRGLFQSLMRYRQMIFQAPGERIGRIALPILFLFGWAQPIMSIFTLIVTYSLFIMNLVSLDLIFWFTFSWWLMNVLYGLISQISIGTNSSSSPVHFITWIRLIGWILLEPLIYRSFLTWWRLEACWHDLVDRPKKWDV